MSIPTNTYCMECLLKKHLATARSLGSGEKAYAFGKEIMKLFLQAGPTDTSAVLGKRINDLYQSWYGLPQDRFTEEKQQSNRFVMERLDKIRSRTFSSADPIHTGLQYAIMGNYIDFSALGKDVSFDTLEQMLDKPEQFAVEQGVLQSFCRELSGAKTLLYITDNAGELGFDQVFAEVLQKAYPQLTITFCVRGKPAHNDATIEDYRQLALPFPVIENGSDIGGTDLASVNAQTIEALQHSDVILSKGMGNTETLWGCGYNIYYAFLVKCKRLQEVFGLPFMSAAFVKEKS